MSCDFSNNLFFIFSVKGHKREREEKGEKEWIKEERQRNNKEKKQGQGYVVLICLPRELYLMHTVALYHFEWFTASLDISPPVYVVVSHRTLRHYYHCVE